MKRRITDGVDNEMTVPQRARGGHLILGFATVLMVMVFIGVYALLRITAINEQLSSVVNIHNVKSEIIANLRDYMRQRQLGLRDMLLVDDEFEKDAAWERHTLAASKFMAARVRLKNMPMTPGELVAFDEMTKGALDGAILQRSVVERIKKGESREQLKAMFEKALRAQDDAFEAMRKLSIYQSNAANIVAKNAQQTLSKTIQAVVAFVIGGLLVGILVAWSVLARDQRMKAALDTYQNKLESIVRKRTAELLNANSELDSYSYSLAHDLNAPLRAMTSYSQILEEDASHKLNENELDSLKRITRAGRVMNRLIEDILKLSRITRSGFHYEAVSLSELAKGQATRLSSLNFERNIKWDIAEDVLVKGDSQLLNLLLEHLLDNAVRFTRDKGAAKIQFGFETIEGTPTYFVRDNGCGFDMRYSDRLFTAFQRLHTEEFAGGTGVGLAMVKRIVQRHGGNVWAESEVGVGSVFYFTLAD